MVEAQPIQKRIIIILKIKVFILCLQVPTNIVEYIKPINSNDVIQAPAISYNKDNDKGSVAFYHEKACIVGGHHYILQLKANLKNDIDLKYSYYLLNEHFSKNMYYQSKEPRANSGTIKNIEFYIPVSFGKYNSLEIQKILANFINSMEHELEEKYFKKMNQCLDIIYIYKETYLKRTFSKIIWS
jgi:hypothetical protein